jgi:hypothetical protein
MTWSKTPNVAMFKGANWDSLIRKVPNCSPEQAKRIALQNPAITFFFFCREYMVLETLGAQGVFNPGDAVFFGGEPWYGSAPQCDSYQKNNITTVYTGGIPQPFAEAGCYTLADGSPAVDVVCIFAANYASDQLPYLRKNNNNPTTTEPFNDNIQKILDSGAVKSLQDKGISVLMTITNGWSDVGWSQFQNEADATAFAQYLKTEVVDKYGLDGIDIDDEYSNGQPVDDSLAMVTTIMKQMMPDKIISKALWNDEPPYYKYFTVEWNGNKLADNLTYGWQMGYSGSPDSTLPPYVGAGMAKNTLSQGFWSNQQPQNPAQDVGWIKNNGYGGVMMFAFDDPTNSTMMGQLVDDLYGAGNWNFDPNCSEG